MTPNPGPSLRDLFLSFLRLGATAFGGPSMVVYIQRLAVERKRWLDERTFTDGVALCQAIPGATAMQTAAYVGLRARGASGAGASFVGFAFPAFLLMTVLSVLYKYTHDLPSVIATFSGLQAITVAIVANATVFFGRTALRTWPSRVIMAAAAVLFWFRVHLIAVILLAALAGLVLVRPGVSPDRSPEDCPRAPSPAKPLLILLGAAAAGAILLAAFRPALLGLAALVATIGIFLPSFLLVIGLAPYFDRLRASPYFRKVITGVLCSFVGLLMAVTLHFSGNVHWDLPHALIAAAAFAALIVKVDILWVVVAGTIVSALTL